MQENCKHEDAMKKTKIRDRQVNGQTDGRTDRQTEWQQKKKKRSRQKAGAGQWRLCSTRIVRKWTKKDRQTVDVDDDNDDVSKSSEAQPSMRQL